MAMRSGSLVDRRDALPGARVGVTGGRLVADGGPVAVRDGVPLAAGVPGVAINVVVLPLSLKT